MNTSESHREAYQGERQAPEPSRFREIDKPETESETVKRDKVRQRRPLRKESLGAAETVGRSWEGATWGGGSRHQSAGTPLQAPPGS